ncbi:transglycosylase SLT domain-containing protein [Methylomicrobium lacus]|uniref:transglycosylase SLT domain-containing protein n=1 Tax=Methylomicrobium lacus TaxID=136992 RepID=UPI0035A96D94
MKPLQFLFLALCLILSADDGWAREWLRERRDFVLAEQAIEHGNAPQFQALADTLTAYPLYPYLQYQWLKKDLTQTDKIRAFLATYKDSRYAPLLRGRWLKAMAEQNRWLDYANAYQAGGDVALECLYQRAAYQIGFRGLALTQAKRLWMSGRSQPGECEPLFTALADAALITREMVWQRFELALKENNRQLAEYLARKLTDADRDAVETWLKVDQKPELIREEKNRLREGQFAARIFAHGIDRMAKSEPESAAQLWDAEKNGLPLDEPGKQMIERRLALALAFQRKAGAYDRLAGLADHDGEVREWRVRSALLEQNWQHIAAALSRLTLDELKEARWQYWQAREQESAGNNEAAHALYAKAALDRSFYGFLAADALSQSYRLADNPVPLPFNGLNELASEAEFQAVSELRALNRNMEAQRQWWFTVAKLSREKRAQAAKLAEYWGWAPVAIQTLVKADYWDDLALRFPLHYREQVQSNALRHDLDPAVIFGVMRQESLLDSRAESPVGAKGLMQVMPKTGRQLAQEVRQEMAEDYSLFDPDLNIRLGAYYVRKLLQRFDGNMALAVAAYNAGPARVAKWLPPAGNIPADIWVETIPYKETRKYVASVLSYAIIYQHRLNKNGLKLNDLMPAVSPGQK